MKLELGLRYVVTVGWTAQVKRSGGRLNVEQDVVDRALAVLQHAL